MSKQENKTSPTSIADTFEPWEQSNPVPLAFLVILVGLFLVSILYYANSHYPEHSYMAKDKIQNSTNYQQPELPAAPVIVSKGNEQVWSCGSCHGLDGMGSGQTPALAGLTADYLNKQLKDFKELTRDNNSMQYVVQYSSDQELADAVNYYAQLIRYPKETTYLGGFSERGKILANQGKPDQGVLPCSSCHAANLAGFFPSLEGQSPDYIFSQLEAFKYGMRTNDQIMPGNVKKLTSEEMRDLAEYFYQQGRIKK